MKTPIAITLIIVGGLLILGPAFSDHLARAQMVAAMSEQNKGMPFNIQLPSMSSQYRFGCWFTGSVMIAAAVLLSRSRGGSSKEDATTAS